MKIGTTLTLKTKHTKTNKIQVYHCKVVEKNEQYLFIDYPTNKQTNRTAYLPKKTFLKVTFIGDDQSVYSFHSQIVSKVNLTIPALAITFPEKNKIKRIQRREYVRIDTAVDLTVHSSDNSFSPFVTVSADISGGGISIVLPGNVELDENSILDIWLVLPMQSGDYQYVYAQTEVVRVSSAKDTVKTASLKFASISIQARQNIVTYCFEKQREARKKELM